MAFGCCLPGASFVPQMTGSGDSIKPAQDSLLANIDAVFDIGYDFAELTCGTVAAMPDSDFSGLKSYLAQKNRVVFAFNSFIPPSIPLTGESADKSAISDYLELCLGRVSQSGGKIVVFGSGAARRFPEGFSPARARGQIIEFLGMCQKAAAARDITICIEPLNSNETNIITSVAEGLDYCKEADLPNIRLLADCFHMFVEGEGYGILAEAAPYLSHVHIADKNRVPPGHPCEKGVDFTAFFKALKSAGYGGGISCECPFANLRDGARISFDFAKKAWEHA